MKGRIYRVTCTVNGKIYIGQTTKPISARWAKHLIDVRERRCAIHNAIRKHGPSAFIIELCDVADLDERECFWIAKERSHDPAVGYNRTFGGNTRMTPESIRKLSTDRKGAGNPMFGRSHTPEVRARMSARRKTIGYPPWLPRYRGSSHPAATIDEARVLALRARFEALCLIPGAYGAYAKVAREFNLSNRMVRKIILRQTWRHV